MNIYTLTFTDYAHNLTILIGTFSSYEKAWDSLLADKDENMGNTSRNHRVDISSNPDLGIGTMDFTPDIDQTATYSYNVNVTELDEALDENHQIEL